MPKLPLRIYELRTTVIKLVDDMLETGEYLSNKSALEYIIKKKPELTGFSKNYNKAYNQYRYFKHKLKKQKQT